MLLVCFWLAFGEDLVGGLGPGEWVAALVPAVDEGADLGVEVLDGGEDSSADGRTVDDGEEDLDHVEPGGAGGGEVDVDARVGLRPGAHLGGLVGCVVVHHQVQLVVGVGAHDLAQEDEQLGTAVAGLAGGCDAAGGDLQGGEQGGGGVPGVVVGAPPRSCPAPWAASGRCGPGPGSGTSRRRTAPRRCPGVPGTGPPRR